MVELQKLKRQYNTFKKSYAALDTVIDARESLSHIATKNALANQFFMAGVIKHFQITYEVAGQFLTKYLIKVHDVHMPQKQVLHACETYNILPNSIVTKLTKVSDACNAITLMDDQIVVQKACDEIVDHYQTFGEILKIIQLPVE